MRNVILVFSAVLLGLAGAASAQTNLGFTGGALFPLGDFGDTTDISPYIGMSLEIQDVNAIGQVAVLSFLVQGGYAFLQADSDLEALLNEQGKSNDGGYFDAGVGARVYSKANPLFISVGASYLNLKIAGDSKSRSGVGGYVGLGFASAVTSFRLSVEGRANVGFFNNDNITHLQALVGFGLPF
jgi:hypothetical protein